jgi:hypothetical protein
MKKAAPLSKPSKTSKNTSFYEFCNTVTPLSKAIAIVLFVAFPFLGFVLGMAYQQNLCSLWW